MRYKKFIIKAYKGISENLEVNFDKNSLLPIIGVNECGKTTILKGIFCFDYVNDAFDENVRHLQDIENLYKTKPDIPRVVAEINVTNEELKTILNDIEKEGKILKSRITYYKRKLTGLGNVNSVIIERDLKERKYSIEISSWNDEDLNHIIATEIVRNLPYILFFDDFRDTIDDKIEITGDKEEPKGWLAIIQRLFKKTDSDFDVFDLPNKDSRIRKTILAGINRTLETTLTSEWKNFKLEDKDALKIQIEYVEEGEEIGKRHYLKFEVIEIDEKGVSHFFNVSDRSKGFFWFFNFVMKLEFNPKIVEGTEVDAVYLLDEPGSYLHASAQARLCKKLKQLSEENSVIYCTHSHYLLDPETIPINSIKVAVKNTDKVGINLESIYDFKGSVKDRKSAFQPIIDALQIKPFLLDLTTKEKTIIVEGIYDYYCFEMFKDKNGVGFLPAANANSIRYFISLMIAWGINYNALWDNDIEGTTEKRKATDYFGDEEKKHFFCLPLVGRQKERILQDLFVSNDLMMIREDLGIPTNSSFEKTILTLFYAPKAKRILILKRVSTKTRQNFRDVLDILK